MGQLTVGTIQRIYSDLVDDDDIGKLDLVDHQIGDGSLVFGRLNFGLKTLMKELDGFKLLEEAESVEHSNSRVELSDLVQASVLCAFGVSVSATAVGRLVLN